MKFILAALSRFRRDLKGSAAAEFVIGLPLILIAQAIAFDFGRVLQERHNLENGVRDAARYLARANLTDCPAPNSYQDQVFRGMIQARLREAVVSSDIACDMDVLDDGSSGDFRDDFTIVQVYARVQVATPLVSTFVDTVTLEAVDMARFIGE